MRFSREMPASRTSAQSNRLLCVEDDPWVGRALQKTLARKIDVDWVTTVDAAQTHLKKRAYLGCLLDVTLPDGSGLDLLAWIRQQRGDLPVLVMTGRSERMLVNRATVLGAEFAFKPELLPSIHAFVDRICLVRDTSGITPTLVANDFASELGMTTRERNVLRRVAAGVPRDAIAAELSVTPSAIDSTVRRVLRKTGKRTLDELLRAILEKSAR
jgi:two-component system, NarL family, response regulator